MLEKLAAARDAARLAREGAAGLHDGAGKLVDIRSSWRELREGWLPMLNPPGSPQPRATQQPFVLWTFELKPGSSISTSYDFGSRPIRAGYCRPCTKTAR